MPNDRVVPEQVQPRSERRRSKLDDQKQHRVDDPDEGHEAGTDRHEHLRRPVRRYRRDDGNPGDEHTERYSSGDANQLHDPGA
jgi:hypothetical protein